MIDNLCRKTIGWKMGMRTVIWFKSGDTVWSLPVVTLGTVPNVSKGAWDRQIVTEKSVSNLGTTTKF